VGREREDWKAGGGSTSKGAQDEYVGRTLLKHDCAERSLFRSTKVKFLKTVSSRFHDE